MKSMLQTVWQAMELIVKRDGREIDRLAASDIERVIIVYRDRGATPGDLAYAVVRTHEHDLLFPPESGIAGRVHFERQSFWRQRCCVYWAPLAKAALPGGTASTVVDHMTGYRYSYPIEVRLRVGQHLVFDANDDAPGRPNKGVLADSPR